VVTSGPRDIFETLLRTVEALSPSPVIVRREWEILCADRVGLLAPTTCLKVGLTRAFFRKTALNFSTKSGSYELLRDEKCTTTIPRYCCCCYLGGAAVFVIIIMLPPGPIGGC